MPSNVCAIIVTRNRAQLLERCVSALARQSLPPDALVIVDNGSTDSTPEYLSTLKAPFEVAVVRQENEGGAGGFERGLREFMTRREYWAWLMDDDGHPADDALASLEPLIIPGPAWRNCIVLDESDPHFLSFGLRHNGARLTTLLEAQAAAKPITACNPFNGTLLSRPLVKAVGRPIKQFFIKGDEMEYLRRVTRHGFVTRTYVNARFYHPALREPSIAEVSKDRAWVYFYKIRNHQAAGESDGSFRLNFRASATVGVRQIRELVKARRENRLTFSACAYRAFIVSVAVTASFLNITTKLFIPRK